MCVLVLVITAHTVCVCVSPPSPCLHVQEKYARTVIARIMYMLDPVCRGWIDGRSLRRSNLIPAFHTVDMEEDINLVGWGLCVRVCGCECGCGVVCLNVLVCLCA